MKITTGISKEIKKQLAQEASKTLPSSLEFTINIDGNDYEAKMYCYVIYDNAVRNQLNGKLEYNDKKTINRIEVYNFNDIDKINKLYKSIFKIDDEDYYLCDCKYSSIDKNNSITMNAVNINRF